MSNNFNFCPMCQSKKITFCDNKKWVCTDCNFTLYCNVAAAVGLIIKDTDGSIIFEVRAKDPKKGFLTLPGGFCDPNESAEEAAFRECLEETGITPLSLKYIASFPNTYLYKNITYKTCDFFYFAQFDKSLNTSTNNSKSSIINKMQAQTSEVTSFKSFKINSIEEIDNLPIAFDSAKNALKTYFLNTIGNSKN